MVINVRYPAKKYSKIEGNVMILLEIIFIQIIKKRELLRKEANLSRRLCQIGNHLS